MKKLSIITALLFPVLLFSQSITFFKTDQTNYGDNSKIYLETHIMHELPGGGYLMGYELNYTSNWQFAYAYYDKYGNIASKHVPRVDYSNPQIKQSKIIGKKSLFISGWGYSGITGDEPFSYCYDSLGNTLWGYKDSTYIWKLLYDTDTSHFGLLEAVDSTQRFHKGFHLVRLNLKGEIYWSKPFKELFKQMPTDTIWNIDNITNLEKYKTNYVFSLNDYRNSDQCRIAAFDKDFKLIGEKRDKHISIIHANDKGIIYNTDIGTRIYPRYQLQQLGWDFKPLWNVSGDSGEVTSIRQRGIISIGSNFCFFSHHIDSNYKWLDEAILIYNYSGIKVRECRYSLNPGFYLLPNRPTNDAGVLMKVSHPGKDGIAGEFVKTDSLGLVYNTDIICDCKDFNVGVSEPKPKPLAVKLFPNPANDKINVLLSHQQKASITLRNLNGQVVHIQQAALNSNIVDISTLEAGVYIVEIESSSGSEVLKFVKQ